MKKLTLVKIGGKVINEEDQLNEFLKAFTKLEGLKLLVHGGGNIASTWMSKLGIEPKMVEGRRITDAATLDVVTMVFSGINKKIVAKLQSNGVQSLGMSGADLNILHSAKRICSDVDFGYVGDIQNVNIDLLKQLIDSNVIPVVCALTHDNQGQLLNTNADTIASELARALSQSYAVDLVYCFEQPGVLSDFENKVVIPEINEQSFLEYKNQGVISEGMIPKLTNAFDAIQKGVTQVKICHFEDLKNVDNEQYHGTVLC